MLEISSTLVARLLTEAAASPGDEICGLLSGNAAQVDDMLVCRNVAVDPASAFEIDPAQLIAAHRTERDGGAAVIGCFHSHPTGEAVPSSRDATSAAPDGWLWLIIAGDQIGVWRAVEAGALHGRFDPVSWQAA